MKYTKFSDIPSFTKTANYVVHTSWRHIEATLKDWGDYYGLQLDPEFQRAHVWSEDQQIRYVEFVLRGGKSSQDIYFNCANWNGNADKGSPLYLVDGKQRLQAVRRFLNNEISAFGTLYKDYEDKLDFMKCTFIFHVNDLKTYKEVLQWYIDLNAGGVAHTKDEIEKVRKMLKKEK
jgi:hypothetical protein